MEEFRASADLSDDHMKVKIKNAQLNKVPYMLVVGEKEMESGEFSVRLRTGKQQKWGDYDSFVKKLHSIVDSHQIEL